MDSAFLAAISDCASSKLLLPDILTIGEAIAKETTAARTTPMMMNNILELGAIIRKAMIEPGEAGPTRPQSVRLNQKIATILPMIGAMITAGFMRI